MTPTGRQLVAGVDSSTQSGKVVVCDVDTGEVVRSDGAPWGKRARKEFPQRPAQPLSEAELEKGADA